MILLGNTFVGKTCIFERITRGGYSEGVQATMVHTFASKLVSVSKVLDSKGNSMNFRDSMKRPGRKTGDDIVQMRVSSSQSISKSTSPRQQSDKNLAASNEVSFDPTEISIRINLWDTVGTERYNSMNQRYFTDAVCAIITYDITDRSSLSDTTKWLAMVDNFCPPNTLKVLVGNKTDLFEDRSVSR